MPNDNQRPVLTDGGVYLNFKHIQDVGDNHVFWDEESNVAVTVPMADVASWMDLSQTISVPVAFMVEWYRDKINRKRLPAVDRTLMARIESECEAIGVELPKPEPEPEQVDQPEPAIPETPPAVDTNVDDEPF